MGAVAAPAKRTAGRLERLCWEREERDQRLAYPHGFRAERAKETSHPKGFWFDDEAADKVIWFVESLCKHHKGKWAGEPLILEEWQRRILRSVFGWMRPNGTRRYRIMYVEVPRKNGKSEIAAALGLYLLVADEEPGAEVYSSATKKDQAKIVHDTAVAMRKASPELQKHVGKLRNNLHCEKLGSKFEPLGADSSTLDGLNVHGNLIDELHAHKDRGVWDVLDTAMGSREQPLTVAITTAGVYDPESIGWEQHHHAVQVLEGALEDDAFYAFIACADAERKETQPDGSIVTIPADDWTQPETWAKANPNIGVSIGWEYLEQQCLKAQQTPSFSNTFFRLHLDLWTQQQDRWLSMEQWNACDGNLSRSEYDARFAELLGATCYGGLDLSEKLDISALAYFFPETRDFLLRFYCPEATVVERSKKDRVPYDAWVRDGWMIATPGNVVDYDFILRDIAADVERFVVPQMAFDSWNANQMATKLMNDYGEEFMVEVRQGHKSMSEPSKEFESLVVNRQLRHGGNPVLRWMASNVSIRYDANENFMPDKGGGSKKKGKNKNRIDGIVASIMALSRALVTVDATSVYESRGLFSLDADTNDEETDVESN